MAILKVDNLRKEFGTRVLFSDVSFSVEPNDHIGLIGINGTGKTSLIKLILKEMMPDRGSVQISSQISIAQMEQNPDLSSKNSLFDFVLNSRADLVDIEAELNQLPDLINKAKGDFLERLIIKQNRLNDYYQREGGLTYRSVTRSFLIGLGFSNEELLKPITEFSGGQIGKALLCRTILRKADLLLLDEPTNNLDIPAITYLQNFLCNYKGAFLIVSHDRSFLDAVTQKIIELENGHIFQTNGNYSRHQEIKQDSREAAKRKYQKTLKKIKRIEAIIEQQKRWNQERNYVTIASKEKQIERLKSTLVVPEKDPQSFRFRFKGSEPTGNEIFSIKDLGFSYPGKKVFHDVNFLIWKSETVCIIGENGCGKSTLMKLIHEDIKPSAGSIIKGAGVRIGYFEQNTDNLNPENTIIEEILSSFPRMEYNEARGYLGSFLFKGDDIEKNISVLSGGERARIKLLKLVLSGANVLLLDEPTNHFDIQSCEVMETALEQFGGTILIVTHDRYLVERMADRVLCLHDDGIEELNLEDDDWFSHIKQTIGIKHEKEDKDVTGNYYKKQKDNKNRVLKLKQACVKIENAITSNEKLQAEKQELIETAQRDSNYDVLQDLCLELASLEQQNTILYEQLDNAEQEMNSLIEELRE